MRPPVDAMLLLAFGARTPSRPAPSVPPPASPAAPTVVPAESTAADETPAAEAPVSGAKVCMGCHREAAHDRLYGLPDRAD